MKIIEILNEANLILDKLNIEDSNLKVKILLSDILNVKKEYLSINIIEEVSEENVKTFFEKLELVKRNIPIQYIIGKQYFYGEEFFVNENVLIPQPDTEILVEEVLNFVNDNKSELLSNQEKLNILDMCTGSGAIAISLEKNLKSNLDDKSVSLFASDISSLALAVSKENNKRLNTNVEFIESDLFNNISIDYKFDIIVSNPPYIKTEVIETLPEEVKNEPHLALDGKEDGLYFYREIIIKSKEYLNKNGMIFFEIGYDQKDDVMTLFKENGYVNIYSKKDYGLNDRIVVGMKGE